MSGLPRWKVVGGGDKGGILVREKKETSSSQLDARLGTNAIIEELQLSGERLHFRKIEGDGPDTGWVSTRLKGKDLLLPVDEHRGARRPLVAWKDLAGQALGPWLAHEDKVTTVHFDSVGSCPRLVSACWSTASVRAWELSARPRQLWEMTTSGLVSDVLFTSASCLLTAVSANPMPSGSVCHQADFKQRMAELDDQLGDGDQLVCWSTNPPAPKRRMTFHQRGCHRLQAWPAGAAPELVASASADRLAVSAVEGDGCPKPEPAWNTVRPHGDGKLRHLAWESAERLWSCDTSGLVKMWDVGSGSSSAITETHLAVENASALAFLGEPGLLIAHETGFAFVDPGSGKLMRQQYTKDVVATACGVSNGQKDQSDFFAGVGCNLVRYETRFAGAEAKSHAVGMWTLPAKVTSVDAVSQSTTLVAVGLQDGKLAVFDAD